MDNYETPDLAHLVQTASQAARRYSTETPVIRLTELIDFLRGAHTSVGTLAATTKDYSQYYNPDHTKCGLKGAAEAIRQLIDGLENI